LSQRESKLDSRIGLKGGIPKPPQIPNVGEGIWFLSDRDRTFGPLSWFQVKDMADSAYVTPWAQIREVSWPQWAPITMYFRVKTRKELEAEALIPNLYDAIFWIAVFIFVLGVLVGIGNPILGIFLMFLSLPLEILAIFLESRQKEKVITRTLGNAIAIVWIVIQFFLTLFIISIVI
jgi:hypothetical protein